MTMDLQFAYYIKELAHLMQQLHYDLRITLKS